MIEKLQDEDNDCVSSLSGSLPPHPFIPDKSKHKKGIGAAKASSEPGSSPVRDE
jgi:hypothetical protein